MKRRHPYVALLMAALMAIASVLPWAHSREGSLVLYGFEREGLITLAAGILASSLIWFRSRWFAFFAIFNLAMGVYEIARIFLAGSHYPIGELMGYSIQEKSRPGIGLWLLVASALLTLFIAGNRIYCRKNSRRKENQSLFTTAI